MDGAPQRGTVTGYRVWRQTGEEAFAVLGSDLAAVDITMPVAAPRQPSCRQTGAATADLTWEPVAGATGYELEYPMEYGPRLVWVALPFFGITITFSGTSVVVANLDTNQATWRFRVRATNGQGDSLGSPLLSVANPDA